MTIKYANKTPEQRRRINRRNRRRENMGANYRRGLNVCKLISQDKTKAIVKGESREHVLVITPDGVICDCGGFKEGLTTLCSHIMCYRISLGWTEQECRHKPNPVKAVDHA